MTPRGEKQQQQTNPEVGYSTKQLSCTFQKASVINLKKIKMGDF